MEAPLLPSTWPVSLGVFEELLEASPVKLELIDGVVYAFAGGTLWHSWLSARVLARLSAAEAGPCHAYTSDAAVVRADDPARYMFPDASFSCEAVAAGATRLVAPCFVLEVVSESSEHRDYVQKLEAYFSIPSVEEYLLVDARRVHVQLARRVDVDAWISITYGRSDRFELSVPGVAIDVAELYAGLAVP